VRSAGGVCEQTSFYALDPYALALSEIEQLLEIKSLFDLATAMGQWGLYRSIQLPMKVFLIPS
jgi:hypothetical protein